MTTKRWDKGLRYPSNWKEISDQRKAEEGWRCQTYGIAENKKRGFYLKTHHLNGDPNDNRPENTRVLCESCHAKADSRGNLKQLWLPGLRAEWASERRLYFEKLLFPEDFK